MWKRSINSVSDAWDMRNAHKILVDKSDQVKEHETAGHVERMGTRMSGTQGFDGKGKVRNNTSNTFI